MRVPAASAARTASGDAESKSPTAIVTSSPHSRARSSPLSAAITGVPAGIACAALRIRLSLRRRPRRALCDMRFLRWYYPDQVFESAARSSRPLSPVAPSSPYARGHRSARRVRERFELGWLNGAMTAGSSPSGGTPALLGSLPGARSRACCSSRSRSPRSRSCSSPGSSRSSGLGPAIFLTAGALAALPAGRLMDRLGRVPVIAGGFVVGMVGCLLTALGCIVDSASLVILGFVGVGAMNGAVLLARTAAADMYPDGEEGPRDLVRPLRRAVRRGARAARLPAALRREGPRARHARHPLVRGGGDVRRRSRDRALDPARSAHDRARARSAPASRRASRTRPSRPRRSGRSCDGRGCLRRCSRRSRASR